MEVKMEMQPRMTIEEFADTNGLTMVVSERPQRILEDSRMGDGHKYYAKFESAEVLEGHFLIGTYGNGGTPEEAIRNYGAEISGRTLVIGAYTPERKTLSVPIIIPGATVEP